MSILPFRTYMHRGQQQGAPMDRVNGRAKQARLNSILSSYFDLIDKIGPTPYNDQYPGPYQDQYQDNNNYGYNAYPQWRYK